MQQVLVRCYIIIDHERDEIKNWKKPTYQFYLTQNIAFRFFLKQAILLNL